MPTLRLSSGPSSCAATAATAPVRRAVIARASINARGSPFSELETQIIPITTGSPWRLLPGNEVTHFRIARPAPLAGIARKSPAGEASR